MLEVYGKLRIFIDGEMDEKVKDGIIRVLNEKYGIDGGEIWDNTEDEIVIDTEERDFNKEELDELRDYLISIVNKYDLNVEMVFYVVKELFSYNLNKEDIKGVVEWRK